MIYNSFNFVIIFPVIFVLYYFIPVHDQRGRNLFLLRVSYLLYANWNPAYTLILLGVTLITFFTALVVDTEPYRSRKFVVGGQL